MATNDSIGVPFPKSHPLFSADITLLKKVTQLESLLEIRNDFDDLEEALKILKWSLDYEKMGLLKNELGFDGMLLIPDIILSYIVVLYAKAFTGSSGRTQLSGQLKAIFKDSIALHDGIMGLRNKFFAHQVFEANRHRISCLRNDSRDGDVKLNSSSQKERIIMAKSINLEIFEPCVNAVKEYLAQRITALCQNIEALLSDEQKKVINEYSQEKLIKENWLRSVASPFKERMS